MNFVAVNFYDTDNANDESICFDKLSIDESSNESGDCEVESRQSCCLTDEEIIVEATGLIEKAILEDDEGEMNHTNLPKRIKGQK